MMVVDPLNFELVSDEVIEHLLLLHLDLNLVLVLDRVLVLILVPAYVERA